MDKKRKKKKKKKGNSNSNSKSKRNKRVERLRLCFPGFEPRDAASAMLCSVRLYHHAAVFKRESFELFLIPFISRDMHCTWTSREKKKLTHRSIASFFPFFHPQSIDRHGASTSCARWCHPTIDASQGHDQVCGVTVPSFCIVEANT